jgi:hypothetical protein
MPPLGIAETSLALRQDNRLGGFDYCGLGLLIVDNKSPKTTGMTAPKCM